LYITGSKFQGSGKGWYDLKKHAYDQLVKENGFCLFTLDSPDTTFVLPSDFLKKTFHENFGTTTEVRNMNRDNSELRWVFDIIEKNNGYYLKFRNHNDEFDLSRYLNNWDLVQGLSSKVSVNYFLIQVNNRGSTNLENNSEYQHKSWRKSISDLDHGKLKLDDTVLVYFTSESTNYKKNIKKVYKIIQISEDKTRINVKEIQDLDGVTLDSIRNAVDEGKLNPIFKKLGTEGFNIAQISENDYHMITKMGNNGSSKSSLNSSVTEELENSSIDNQSPEVFLSSYPEQNISISKKYGLLGWEKDPKDLSSGDYVFIYNKDAKKIDCGFKIISRSNHSGPVWTEETENINHPIKFKFRYNGELICDDYNLNTKQIHEIEPFKSKKLGGKGAHFGVLLVSNSANSLRNPIYQPFKQFLINRCINSKNTFTNPEKKENWSFDTDQLAEAILSLNKPDELAIDKQIVKRIILHLKAGKNVILVGPPGVGKTDLARRILRLVGEKVIGNSDFLEAVASDEWSRFEVIGGINLENKFQEGWITKSVSEGKWLLIDEFNRANMNKAFGEMFLGIEYKEIKLRPSESKYYNNKSIKIPNHFRILCTMNDFDKNLLLTELSYGLVNRFAFVSIFPNIEREPEVVSKRIKSFLNNDSDYYEKCSEQIDTYFRFINLVRKDRIIGVRSSIDVIKYLLSATIDSDKNNEYHDNNDKYDFLNEAVCDYILPQFDRLDVNTLENVLNYANSHLTNSKFKPFKDYLQNDIDKLRKVTGWFTNTNEI
jgi:MoxR-like ATPase